MKILVCVKIIKGELNPFDESALECALQLSDDVTVVSMGPKSCENVLKPLTRLGAKAILITDNVFAGSDTLATSYILSTAIKQMEYDLIICGRQSVDGDTAQVGPMLSQMLKISLITNALQVNCEEDRVLCSTRLGEEAAPLPALVTVERGYVLRFPSIFSKVGNVEMLSNADLNCALDRCGLQGSPTRVLKTFENERGKRKCKFISMSELEPLIEELKQKPSLKMTETKLKQKFQSVWAVGKEVEEKAAEIADNVTVIEKSNAETIAELILKEKPSVVLWNADLWGRKTAPQVAAIVKTGLCADCTELEEEGDNLIMYRPAQGGNIYAKIKCLTMPQMATVRTSSESSDIIVAGGKGVADNFEKLKEFADKIGAQIAASRGLVDMGKVPYDMQIGLTGKSVSPKIYIAVGISGAVHHTCAIEGADVIIAINTDKSARIFDYADYAIVDAF
ncbi:MAG: FAD-binding protein [Clostridia bacterium]|nr:FAD-binding protein [Clostridia bacterium]